MNMLEVKVAIVYALSQNVGGKLTINAVYHKGMTKIDNLTYYFYFTWMYE